MLTFGRAAVRLEVGEPSGLERRHPIVDIICAKSRRAMSGTIAFSSAKPATRSRNGRSSEGRSRILLRNRMGLGVCVSVATPALWSAVISRPVAMPTDSGV